MISCMGMDGYMRKVLQFCGPNQSTFLFKKKYVLLCGYVHWNINKIFTISSNPFSSFICWFYRKSLNTKVVFLRMISLLGLGLWKYWCYLLHFKLLSTFCGGFFILSRLIKYRVSVAICWIFNFFKCFFFNYFYPYRYG